ncbi:MAG: osmotically inducible periplasmic protein [Ramlibacter sp.]|jgi:hyperosmotically inducible protein|nr:osmotically inducible periplasmic protein [Ramlibacter sp.]MDB5915429.1 osmotically inducible periplasmic protein [Ramlibacter sp.]
MMKQLGRVSLTACALAALLALGACGERVDTTAQGGHPSVEINRQGEDGTKRETAQAAPAVPDTSAMGASPDAGVSVDARIATEVQRAIATDADLAGMKIDVSSQEGQVTLRGRAPDPGARDRATELARTVRDVKSVENQLTLG